LSLVRTYGFLNAKIRAMRSTLLLSSQYKVLSNAKDYRDLLQQLSQYGYTALVDDVGYHDPDRLELALQAEELRRLKQIQKKSNRSVQNILNKILERYEAERLKWMLRLWFQKRGEPNSFPLIPILYPIPINEIMNAPILDDVFQLLDKHPFYNALIEARSEFEAKQTLFPFELAIDREQIKRFIESVKRLNRRDQRICNELLGIEIDLRNLSWIERFRKYYQLSAAEILTRLLPGGHRLGPSQLRQVVSDGNPSSIFTSWEKDIPIPIQGAQESKFMLQNVELFLTHVLLRRARRAFMEFPFSIGAIMGYSTLLRIEMMNIRMLIQAKEYKLSADEVESRLVY